MVVINLTNSLLLCSFSLLYLLELRKVLLLQVDRRLLIPYFILKSHSWLLRLLLLRLLLNQYIHWRIFVLVGWRRGLQFDWLVWSQWSILSCLRGELVLLLHKSVAMVSHW